MVEALDWFNFRGRIGRFDFWVRTAVVWGLLLLSAIVGSSGAPWPVIALFLAPSLVLAFSNGIKRAKDVSGSMLGLFVIVVPVINAFILGFFPGQKKTNQFGPPPSQVEAVQLSPEEIAQVSARVSGK